MVFPSDRVRDLFLARLRYLLFESTVPKGSLSAPFPIYITPEFVGPTLSVFCATWNVGESAPPAPHSDTVRHSASPRSRAPCLGRYAARLP